MAQIFLNWADIIDPFAPPIESTTQFVINNSDGLSRTVFTGTGFVFDGNGFPTAGTISSISLVLNAGDVVLQTLTNVDPTALADIGSFASQAFDLRVQIGWLGVINQNAEPILFTPTEIRLRNTDGTITVVIGSAFAQVGETLSGTVNTIELRAADGTTVLDPGLTGLTVGLDIGGSALFDSVRSTQTYLLANQGNNTLTSVNNGVVSGLDTIFVDLTDGPDNDTLNGGVGIDTADYHLATANVTANLSLGTSTGGSGTDTLNGIENLRASNFDDFLIGDNNNNVLDGGNGGDVLQGLAGADTLIGGGSFDRASYANMTVGITVDLANAANNTLEASGDVFISIEGLEGGSGDDLLRGDALSNFFYGGAGADTLDGGGGNDFAHYVTATAGLTASLANPVINTGDAAGDSYISIESLSGSQFGDRLVGDAGNNSLRGNLGADTLDGGAGFNTADYFGFIGQTTGVTVDLGTPSNNTGEAAGDVFISIENVRGSRFADLLRGNANTNYLDGQAGADTLDGSAGFDLAWYSTNSTGTGVTASLAAPGINTGDAAGDVYISIEGLSGSGSNDVLIGDSGANRLEGNFGNDVLRGSAGADTLDGGLGFDRASYSNATVGITVDLSTPGNNTGDAIGDVFISIENLEGGSGNDLLRGDGNSNLFIGNAGSDTLDGGTGGDTADYRFSTTGLSANLATNVNTGDANGDVYLSIENLNGGSGNDILTGNDVTNFLRGNGGADTLDGASGFDFADYFNATAGLTVELGGGLRTGEALGDVFISIEGLRGSTFNDLLVGDANTNIFDGLNGADTLDGGDGFDYASYSTNNSFVSSVTASLANPFINNGDAAGDSYISIEGLIGSANGDFLQGDGGDNFLRGQGGADTLDGGAGADYADYINASAGITVDLGNTSNNTGEAVGDNYISIERLRGGAFNDLLRGDAGDNALRGGLGLDTLDGAAGFDFASYSDATIGITASLATPGINTGEAAGDVYISIEGLRGSNNNDRLIGNTADNFLNGGPGGDTLDGGAGFDYADYGNATAAVVVNLGNPAGNSGEALGDSYISIEGIRGSDFADTLVGNTGDNFLRGGLGADSLNGGAGSDWADYFRATSAVTANLATGGTGGEATGDTYTLVENIRGSDFADNLTGSTGDNFLRGGPGGDTLDGGAGFDYADYINATAAVVVNLANPLGNSGEALGDSYISIEGIAGSNFADNLIGNTADNFLRGGLGADALNGQGGFDWADYQRATAAVTANLTTPASNTGEAAGDTYTSIEGIVGSAFNDTLVGNGIDNFLRGGLGADALNGQGGFDWADYQRATAAVTANLTTPASNTGEAAGDTYTSIEGIVGSAFNDTLVGNGVDNFLRGGLGADALNGQGGFDWADYQKATAAVTANLTTPASNTGEAAGDTYTSIEGIVGSAFNDTLVGNGVDNFLRGGLGADALNGQGGFDWADYQRATAAVTANLTTPASNTGEAAGDTYTSIEGIVGSAFNDTLVGNGVDNFLRGGLGADALNGQGGFDWADYQKATAAVTANLTTPASNTGEAAGDTYTSIEGIVGSAFNDTLVGNAVENFLRGGLGGDALDGQGGFDWADYLKATSAVTANLTTPGSNTGEAAGDTYASIEGIRGSNFGDNLTGNASANTLQGGLGNDTLTGGAGADQFLFNTAPNSSTNFDTIVDFVVVDDTVRLENAIFTAFATAGTIAADRFVSGAGAAALDANDNIIYDTATGALFYDADGSGVGVAIEFATITPGLALTNLDFFIV